MALKPVEILITARDTAKGVIDKLRQSAASLSKSLRGVKTAANQAEQAEKNLEKAIKSLETAADQSTAAEKNLSKAKKELAAASKNAQIAQKKQAEATQFTALHAKKAQEAQFRLTRAQDSLASASKTAQLTQNKLTKAIKNEAEAVKQAEAATKRIKAEQDKLSNSNKKLSNSFKTAAVRIGAFVAAAVGLRKIKDGFLEIINTGARFEILNKQLAAVMGTVEGGEAAFAWIEDFAKNTPLQLEDVTKAFVRMKAFGLDPMDGTMQKLVDANAKLGGSQETLNGIVLAVGQAWTKQKLQAEEANQLIERGIPVWDLLAKQMGKTTAEVIALSTAGALGQKEIAGLIDAIGDSATGAAADQMKTLTGLTSNLQDTFTRFLDSIAQSGVLDAVKAQLNEIANTVQRMASDGSLKRLAQDISDGFITAGTAIKDTISFIAGFSSEIVVLAKVLVTAKLVQFAGGLRNIGLAATSATLNTKKLTAAIAGISKVAGLTALSAALFDVVDKLILAKKAANDLKTTQSELDESTTQRIGSLRAEAEALELNISKQGENITAIVDAILARKEEIAALEAAAAANRDYAAEVEEAALRGQEVSAGVLKLASAAGVSADEIDRLSQSSRTIINDFSQFESQTGGVKKALEGLELTRIAEMQKDLNKAFEAGLVSLETFKRISQELADNQLARLGISLQEIRGEITEFGTESVAAFNRLAQSASLTKKQLTSVAVQLVATAKTKGDIEALKNTFRAAGIATGAFSQVGQVLEQQLIKINQAAGNTEDAIDDLANSYREAGAAQISSEQEVEDAAEEAAENAKARASALASILINLRQRVSEYGDAWVDTFNKQIVSFEGEGGTLFFDRLGKNFKNTINLAKQFNKEAVKNAESLQLMAEGGAASADQLEIMRNLMQESLKDADKLSDANLDKLKNSLAAANQQLGEMAAFSKSAADTLTTLKNNLDQLNDNDAAIEQRKLQEERLKLEEDLQEARRRGNQEAAADLQGSIGLLNEINTIKQQNIAIEKLTTIGISESAQELTAMRDIMEDTLNSSQQLSQANVDKLKDSIERANRELEKMNDFADSASDKLDSLKDEWDRLNDNQAAIDQRQFQQDRLELEAELQTARQEGNEEALKDLQASLSLLTQINQKKQQNNALDAISSTTETTSSPAVTPAAPQPPSASTRTVNIEFVNGNTNRTINAAFDSQNEADEFLEILKQMGTVT